MLRDQEEERHQDAQRQHRTAQHRRARPSQNTAISVRYSPPPTTARSTPGSPICVRWSPSIACPSEEGDEAGDHADHQGQQRRHRDLAEEEGTALRDRRQRGADHPGAVLAARPPAPRRRSSRAGRDSSRRSWCRSGRRSAGRGRTGPRSRCSPARRSARRAPTVTTAASDSVHRVERTDLILVHSDCRTAGSIVTLRPPRPAGRRASPRPSWPPVTGRRRRVGRSRLVGVVLHRLRGQLHERLLQRGALRAQLVQHEPVLRRQFTEPLGPGPVRSRSAPSARSRTAMPVRGQHVPQPLRLRGADPHEGAGVLLR